MATEISRRNLFRLRPFDFVELWRESRDGAQESPAKARVRPPGAIQDEVEFLSVCERCAKCSEACPFEVIEHLGPVAGMAEGTPVLDPETKPCHWCPSFDCIHACPTMALSFDGNQPVAPIAKAALNLESCLGSQGILCDTCVMHCPAEIHAIRMRGRFPMLDEERCVGCGLCAFHCEAEPRAIRIRIARSREGFHHVAPNSNNSQEMPTDVESAAR